MSQVILSPKRIQYGSFWSRVGALVLDTLVFLPITIPVTIFNATDWKSNAILIITSILVTGYKPFMEYKYGATLGKMGVHLKVTNMHLEKPSLQQILLRNIFYIISGLASMFMTLAVFNIEGFEEIETYTEYMSFNAENGVKPAFYSFFVCLVYLIDCIFLWADDQNRSLHDLIGRTLVVNKFTQPAEEDNIQTLHTETIY